MARFRVTLTLAAPGPGLQDQQVEQVIPTLSEWHGSVALVDGQMRLNYEIDAQIPTGFGSGIPQAVPKAIGIARLVLQQSGLETETQLVGLHLDLVNSDDPADSAPD